jgi:malonyl-CoA/methylmalonyl-CoA synthetase
VGVLVPRPGPGSEEAIMASKASSRRSRASSSPSDLVLDELPRNTMGKVQKNVLRDAYKALLAG